MRSKMVIRAIAENNKFNFKGFVFSNEEGYRSAWLESFHRYGVLFYRFEIEEGTEEEKSIFYRINLNEFSKENRLNEQKEKITRLFLEIKKLRDI